MESDALTGADSSEAALLALHALSDAVLAVASERSVPRVLERLVEVARNLVGARYAAIGIPDDEGGFAQFITTGMSDELIARIGPLPRTHGLLGALLSSPEPYRTDDIRSDPRFAWWPEAHPRMRSFLGVPIVYEDDVVGAFYLTDKEGAPAFSDADERLIGILAGHAGIALDNARLFERSRELTILEERNRLARELHDAMTQTLFSLSLCTRAALDALAEPGAEAHRADEWLRQAEELATAAQAELRGLVQELRPPALDADGLVVTIGKHLALLQRVHQLRTTLNVSGDGRLPARYEVPLLRVTQEALANVVRHAGATTVTIDLDLRPARVRLAVRDDGAGFDPEAKGLRSRRLGLTSMRERAEGVGGRFEVQSAPGAGTTVSVEVPLD